MTRLATLCVLLLTLPWVGALGILGCTPEPAEPYFDDSLNIEAIPVEPGALAGTFALKTVNATLVHIPVLDDQQGGGVNYRLVTRTANDDGTYAQSSVLCGGYNIEVAGVVTDVPQSSYRRVPRSEAEIVTVGDDGQYAADGHIQLWALDFEAGADPFTTPLPATAEEAAASPHKERIYDFEEDGNPGMTMIVTGLVNGEVYAIQRKFVDLTGVVLGPDRVLGLAENSWENLMIANNNELLDRSGEGSAERYPDPKESWFEEVRLPEGSDCEDVLAAVDDQALSPARPF